MQASKRALYTASAISALLSILSIGARLLSTYLITSETILLFLPGFVLLCDFLALVSIASALTVIFTALGLKKTIANSLLPLFILFVYSFASLMIKDFAPGEDGQTTGIILELLGSALLDLLIFALRIFGAMLLLLIFVYIKSKKGYPRAILAYGLKDASPLRADTPSGLGLFMIPLSFFLTELVLEVIETVDFFSAYFDTYTPSELVYMSLYYLYLVILFAVGLILCKAVKDFAVRDTVFEVKEPCRKKEKSKKKSKR